ncbi:MAG: DUF4852 domain-containing protein [Arcobacteraceae bacterium]
MTGKILLSSILLATSMFADVNLNDESVIDKLGLAGLKDSIKMVNKQNAGEWYLYRAQKSIYDKVINDEFEYDDAWNKAYTVLNENITQYQAFIGQESTINLNASIGKYDFKNQKFPVAAMTPRSFLSFNGTDRIVWRGNGSNLRLTFDNVNIDNNFLPMEKAAAKAFIKQRKSQSGSVDRGITAKYTFTISSVNTPISSIENCSKGNNCGYIKIPELKAHIKKMDIVDDNGQVLTSYTYK